MQTIKTCFSDHRILRQSIKENLKQSQKNFQVDDTTVTENFERLKKLINRIEEMNGEQLANV